MTRTTVFTVQTVTRRAERLVASRSHHFRTADEAMQAAFEEAASSVGVLVVEFVSDTGRENWRAPRLIAYYGDVPLSLAGT